MNCGREYANKTETRHKKSKKNIFHETNVQTIYQALNHQKAGKVVNAFYRGDYQSTKISYLCDL